MSQSNYKSPGNKKKKSLKPLSQRYTLTNSIVNYFLVVAFAIFPLYVNITIRGVFPFISLADGFRGIRHQKYYFFVIMAAAALIAEIMLLITKTSEQKKEADPKKQNLLKTITFTDWAVIAFVLSCSISTVFSPYIDMAVTGSTLVGGRDNGLILMLFYAAVYFLITRCYRYKEYVFLALAGTNAFIYLIAVLNGFYLDPLGTLETFNRSDSENQFFYMNFLSTIGNKNMFASHICVTLPAITAMFVHTEKLVNKIVYLASAALGAMAVVICDSDSVVLGMGAFIAVFTVVYSRRPEKMKKFLLALTAMLLSIKLLRFFSYLGGDGYKELSAIPYKVMLSDKTFVVIAVLAALTALAYYLSFRHADFVLPKAVPIALASLFSLAALAGVGVIVYYSAFDTTTDLGELEKTLRFSDAWGTHRGIFWDRAIRIFGERSFFQKLFGSGPETFYYAFEPFFPELWEYGDGKTDAAHNEYINYLITIGIAGLASYLTFTGSALVRAFRSAKQNPLALVFAAPVVAYLAQAVVNIAVPIATPIFVIFVALCETAARQTKEVREPEYQTRKSNRR